jgi:glycerol-3-phosphate dehydrogenase (NAD(P)+)
MKSMDHPYTEPELAQRDVLETPTGSRRITRGPADVGRDAHRAETAQPAEETARPTAEQSADLAAFRDYSLRKGVNPFLYRFFRSLFVPSFLIYFRMRRIGRKNLPKQGALLLASNHRSFLDPFVIGTCLQRPVYYMAKRELFEKRWQAWILNSLGAFPVDRGAGDGAAMDTAKAILARGDCVVVFPEGTRVRSGPLGTPRRGIGRLALETGVPVAPVSVFGSEEVRRGWRIRPRKVSVRIGRPMSFPNTGSASPAIATGVTERVWACVSLQWEWLGGARREDAREKPATGEARAA